jgi:hypothetical protein
MKRRLRVIARIDVLLNVFFRLFINLFVISFVIGSAYPVIEYLDVKRTLREKLEHKVEWD